MVPRDTVRPISAWPSSCVTGLSFLPANSRGAVASSDWPMAVSATATGAMTCEARVTGCNGLGGCRMASASGSPLSVGTMRLSIQSVTLKNMATTQKAATPQRT